jgi:hypothetical protein
VAIYANGQRDIRIGRLFHSHAHSRSVFRQTQHFGFAVKFDANGVFFIPHVIEGEAAIRLKRYGARAAGLTWKLPYSQQPCRLHCEVPAGGMSMSTWS